MANLSLAHVSNLEHSRDNIGDRVVSAYVQVLSLSGEETHELRKRAQFANGIRRSPEPSSPNTPLQVMLGEFGDRISPSAREKIQKIIEEETGEKLDALTLASNKMQKNARKLVRDRKRPNLSPEKLVEIALLAEQVRNKIAGETARVDISLALEKLSFAREKLDYRVSEALPSALDGAFAAIVGHKDGHTILLEEQRFLSASNGVHFARHVVAHELGHHFLHSDLLRSQEELWLPPQQLAKNTVASACSDSQVRQVVDTIEEVEAECFATLFLVPWTAFLKGTEPSYLSTDYGEQLNEVNRYARFFKLEPVKDAFRSTLWAIGKRQHPIFNR